MERSGLFSSGPAAPAYLPSILPLCPRSLRINVARHAAKNRMADPREYIYTSGNFETAPFAPRMCNWLAARACARREISE